MYVGIARLTVVLSHSHSLKEKRMVLRRIRDRVRERVGIAINEVGEQDSWQRAELGVAVTSGERGKALELLDDVVRVAMSASDGQVVAVARDAWKFDVPSSSPVPTAAVDDRTGAGDKAAGSDDWVPDAWNVDE